MKSRLNIKKIGNYCIIRSYCQPRLRTIVSWALKQNLEVPISIELACLLCFLYLIKNCPTSRLCITCRHCYHMRLLRNLDPCLSTQREKSIKVQFFGQLFMCRTCNTCLSCNCKNDRFNNRCNKWLPVLFFKFGEIPTLCGGPIQVYCLFCFYS